MRRGTGGVCGAAVAAWLLACGDADGARTAPAAARPSEAAPPAAAGEPPIPAAATPAPAAGAPAAAQGDPAKGELQYASLCASCHGPRGDGDGPLAEALSPHPAKHSDGQYMNALSDEHLFRVIKEGGPAVGKSPLMAPWGGVLRDDQIRDVIAFIRSLAK